MRGWRRRGACREDLERERATHWMAVIARDLPPHRVTAWRDSSHNVGNHGLVIALGELKRIQVDGHLAVVQRYAGEREIK
jgi:hypothetical protein